MLMFFIPLIISLSLLFTLLNHPLAMGLNLLFQTFAISLIVGSLTYSFWFSYILFLIFLGGMLVLFIYVASLASNEKFLFSLSTFITFFLCLTSLSLIFFIFFDSILVSNLSNLPSSSIFSPLSTSSFTSWIFNYPSLFFTAFIIMYLLLALIVVIKIMNLFKGPLRLTN